MMSPRSARFLATLSTVSALALPAHADSVGDFYKSHPITLVIGSPAGGGFDLYGRVVARYFSKHLPGNPNVIVQDMPGAGSILAANHMYNVAAKDGTAIAMVRAPVMDALTGSSSTAFDATKFTWLGNGMTELSVCAQLGNPNINSIADAQKYPFTIASMGPGSDEEMFTKVLNRLFGLKDKIIAGYAGGADAVLAIERGEVDGRCGWSYSSIMIMRPQWVADKRLKILAALSLERIPGLPDTPSIMEFATTDRQKNILKLLISCEAMGRPFLAPPGIPADRAAALRKAFEDTMEDPEFVAERRAAHEPVNPMSWQELDALIKQLYATPKDLLDETRAIIAER
jgi:tripartite-type tricarboxylate transporter receptor subunit TctC